MKTLSKAAAGSLVLANDLRHGGRAVIKLLDRGPGVTKNLEREILTHRRCGPWALPASVRSCLRFRRPKSCQGPSTGQNRCRLIMLQTMHRALPRAPEAWCCCSEAGMDD